MTRSQETFQKAMDVIRSPNDDTLVIEALETILIAISTQTISVELDLINLLKQTTSERIVELCCLILDKVYVDLNMDSLVMALQGPPQVQTVALRALLKTDSFESLVNPKVLEMIVMLLESDHKTYETVRLVLKKLENIGVCLDPLCEVLQHLLSRDDDLITIRVYETVSDIAIASPKGFELMKQSHLLDPFLQFSFDDLLVCLNMIQVFIELSKSENGFDFLEQTNIFVKMADISKIDNHFILGSVISFWGFVMYHCPSKCEDLETKYQVLKLLHGLYASEDIQVMDKVMVSVGNIGSTKQGLLLLAKQQHLLNSVLETMPRVSGTLRISGLRTMSCLLSNKDVECVDTCRLVYHSVGREPFKVLVQFAKSSIEEVSIAALACIKEVVQFPWGLRDFAQSDTHSFFLERQKQDHVIREWKYSIVQQVAMNQNALSYFAVPVFDRFVEFNRQGPFKTDYTPQVAFENM